MDEVHELSGAERALFEALMFQGCSPVEAARIACEQAEAHERARAEFRKRADDMHVVDPRQDDASV